MYHLKGQKFGRLLVLERSDVTDKSTIFFGSVTVNVAL